MFKYLISSTVILFASAINFKSDQYQASLTLAEIDSTFSLGKIKDSVTKTVTDAVDKSKSFAT